MGRIWIFAAFVVVYEVLSESEVYVCIAVDDAVVEVDEVDD